MATETTADFQQAPEFYQQRLAEFCAHVNAVLRGEGVQDEHSVTEAIKSRVAEFELRDATLRPRARVEFSFPYEFEHFAGIFVFVWTLTTNPRAGLGRPKDPATWKHAKGFAPMLGNPLFANSYRKRHDNTMSYRAYRLDADVGYVFLYHVVRVSETPHSGRVSKKKQGGGSASTKRRKSKAAAEPHAVVDSSNIHIGKTTSHAFVAPASAHAIKIKTEPASGIGGLYSERAPEPAMDIGGHHVSFAPLHFVVPKSEPLERRTSASTFHTNASMLATKDEVFSPWLHLSTRGKRKRDDGDELDDFDVESPTLKRAKNLDGFPMSPSFGGHSFTVATHAKSLVDTTSVFPSGAGESMLWSLNGASEPMLDGAPLRRIPSGSPALSPPSAGRLELDDMDVLCAITQVDPLNRLSLKNSLPDDWFAWSPRAASTTPPVDQLFRTNSTTAIDHILMSLSGRVSL
eukprot:Amastigsp_a341907_62.p2 type:complete len:460 gc:universal Amastigsp_a341907_62:157-1536(+)